MMRRVLVVEDDKAVRDALGQSLELADLDPVLAGSFVAAKDFITAEFDGVILSDIRMPGRDGFHLLTYAQEQDPDLPVVLLTGEGDIPMAVQATQAGAFDFLEKPCAPKDLMRVLERALKTRELILENRALKAQMQEGDPAARMLFGISQEAEGLRDKVRRIGRAGSDALILGPAGSGIPKVAEVTHLCSARAGAAFEKRASRGLAPNALDAALEAARLGSLFLDEAVHLPMETQLRLGEALEHGDRARVFLGASGDMQGALDSGAFSSELYYRFSGVSVVIPSLAERREDIPDLFQHYVAQAAEQAGLAPPEITPGLLSDLMGRDWPGNARALMSEAMRFVLDLQDEETPEEQGLVAQMARVEKSLLAQALRKAGGRAAVAAEALQVPRKTFYDKLAKHGLRPEDYRP